MRKPLSYVAAFALVACGLSFANVSARADVVWQPDEATKTWVFDDAAHPQWDRDSVYQVTAYFENARTGNGGKGALTVDRFTIDENGDVVDRAPFLYRKYTASAGDWTDGADMYSSLGVGPMPDGTLAGYFWDWAGNANGCSAGQTKVTRLINGETVAKTACAPAVYNNRASGQVTGGEVDQQTGKIYFSGLTATDIDSQNRVSDAANTSNGFSFTIWDPNTGDATYSGYIQPATQAERRSLHSNWAQLANPSSTATGIEAYATSDMALDANGNIYMLADTSEADHSVLLRILPARDDSGQPISGPTTATRNAANVWYYNVVSHISRAGSITFGSGAAGMVGSAFYNGKLYAGGYHAMGTVPARRAVLKVDPLAGTGTVNATATPFFNTSTNTAGYDGFDFASSQTAAVIEGTVYNDVNGDGDVTGDPGLAGQTVAIYDDTNTIVGVVQTDSEGDYSLLIGDTNNATYYVRIVQPQIDSRNAVQTWAAATASDPNKVTAYCLGEHKTSDGACSGNLLAPYSDPAVGAVGSTADPATFAFVSEVLMTTSNDVADANFAFSLAGSYGDAPAQSTQAQNGAVFTNGSYTGLRLGAELGRYTDGTTSADASAHATDDGVFVQLVNGATVPLQGQAFSVGRSYPLEAVLGGDQAAQAVVKGWYSGIGTGSGATALSGAPIWQPSISSGKATGTLNTASTAPSGALATGIFRAIASTGNISAPDNAAGAYSSANPWVSFGEVEDYQVAVAQAQVRLALRTVGGTSTVSFALTNAATTAPSSATDSLTTTAEGVAVTSAKLHAISSRSAATVITATAPTGWNPVRATCVDSLDGSAFATATFDASDGKLTIPADAIPSGGDLLCTFDVVKFADPNSSTLTVTPTTAQSVIDGEFTAVTTTKTAEGTLIGSQEVSYKITTDAAGANVVTTGVTLSNSSCTTDITTGQCEVTITADVAGTYYVHAAIAQFGGTTAAVSGSPKQITFNAGPASAAHSKIEKLTTGDKTADGSEAHQVRLTLKDELDNPIAGADATWEFSADLTAAKSPTTTGADGTLTVSFTTEKAGSYDVAAKIGGTAVVGSPVSLDFVPGPPYFGEGYTELLLTKTGDQVLANNSDFWTGTLTVRDEHHNVIPNVAVTWPTTLSGAGTTTATVYDTQSTTGSNGQATAKVKSGDVGEYTLTAQVAGQTVTGTPKAVFTSGSASATHSTLEATTGTRVADNTETHTLTATVLDSDDHPVSGVTLTWEGLDAAGLTATGQSAASGADGKIVVTVKSTKTGDFAIHAKLGGTDISGSPKTITFVPGPLVVGEGFTELLLTKTGDVVLANNSDFWTGTLTARDQYKNVIPNVAATWPATLTAGSGTATVFDTQAATGTDGQATAKVKSGDVGEYTLTVQVAGQTVTGTPKAAFSSGSASATHSTLEATTGTRVADNTETHTLTATVLDSSDNPVSGVTLTWEGLDAAGLTATGQTAASGADGKIVVTVKSTKAGDFAIHAKLGGTEISGSPKTITFVPGPPVFGEGFTELLLTKTGDVVLANDSDFWTGTLTVRDQYKNVIPNVSVTWPTTLSGAGTTTATVFDTQAATGTSGQATAKVKSGDVGEYTLTAQVAGQTVTGTPKAAFSSGSASATHSTLQATTGTKVANNIETHTLTATVLDSDDHPVAGVTLTWEGLDAAGLTATGQSAASGADGKIVVTVKSTKAGDFAIHAKLGGTEISGSPKTITFVPGPPVFGTGYTELLLTKSGGQAVADNSDFWTGTLTVRDQYKNVIPNVAVTWPTSISGNADTANAATVFDAQATTNTSGKATAKVKSGNPDTYTLIAQVDSTAVTGTPDALFTTGAPTAVNSTLEATTGTRFANNEQTHTLTATVRDANDLPVSGVVLTWEGLDATGLTATGQNAASDADGKITVTVKSTQAGIFPIHATLSGTDISGSPKSIQFVPPPVVIGPPSAANSDLVALTSGNKRADGVEYHRLRLTIRDAADYPVAGASADFTYSTDLNVTLSSDVSDANGEITLTITTTKAGSYPVQAALGGTQVNGSPKTVRFVAGPANATHSQLTLTKTDAAAAKVLANGVDSYTATVIVRDAYDNPVQGATIDFSSTATVAAASGTSNASGQVATTVTSTAAGTFPVHAKLAGADVANSPRNAVFSAGEAVAGHSELVKLTSGDKVADGVDAHQVKVIVRDGFDNPVAGVSVAWGYSTVTGTPSAAVTDANGEITLTITSTRSGSYPISASVGGEQVRNSPVTVSFVAGEASAETSVIEITPPILDVSQTATVKVTLMDAFGNLLGHGGDDVALEKITGSGLLAAGDVTLGALTDNGDGTYTASIGSSKAGTARVGFTVNGDEGANTAQVVFTFDSDADPDTSAFSVSKTSATADGVDYITGSAVVRNAASQPIANAQVVFSVPANLKGGSANGPASVTAVTNGSGVAEIRYTTTVAAQYQVGANVAAGAISGSPKTITFTAGAPDPGRSEIAIAPNPQAVGQASTITVTLRDAFGNLASATGATIELALVTGTDRLSATEAAIGTSAGYANGVKAPINATKRGTAEVSYTLNGTAGGSTATVRFTKAPDAPVIEVANATEISGTAEPGSTITITLPNGSSPAKVEVTTGADGHWTANTPDGAVSGDFTVVASNPDGSSPPVTGSLDAIRPDPPVIEKAEPDEIAGTGEPGAIVVIELPDGTKITEDIDDGGNWVVRPDTPIEPGTVITVTVVDPAGNESDPVQVVVGALSVPATIYVTTNQNTPVTVDVLARATGPVEIYLHSYGDAGSGTVSYNAAASGFEVLPANAKGTLTYTPGTDYVGADQFTVTLVDARGIKATTTVSVDVLEVEQPDYNTGGVLVPGGNAGLILLLAMGVTLAAVAARRKAE